MKNTFTVMVTLIVSVGLLSALGPSHGAGENNELLKLCDDNKHVPCSIIIEYCWESLEIGSECYLIPEQQ